MTRVEGPQEISGETKARVEPGSNPDGIDLISQQDGIGFTKTTKTPATQPAICLGLEGVVSAPRRPLAAYPMDGCAKSCLEWVAGA